MSEERCGSCANEKFDRMREPCLACVDNDTAKVDKMVRASQYIAKAGAAPEPQTEPAVAGGAGAETEVVTDQGPQTEPEANANTETDPEVEPDPASDTEVEPPAAE